MFTKLTDIYEIRPNLDIQNLDAEQKAKLLDAATSVSGGKKRGLIITFDLSSSFRRTNNRLYTAQGQRAGIDSWTQPYPKPIIRNHDSRTDPIGRIISVEWVSNDQEAVKFFSSIADFMHFKRVMDTGQPKAIYKEMLKRNFLTNDKWPGLGKLVAKARISDPDAIEKFLDGRYLTFSAGSSTDSYNCGICGNDWTQGSPCEHSPGSISEDGEPAVYITGIFSGREASVVTDPGNGLSQLVSMEFGDSVELSAIARESLHYDTTDIQFTDASVDIGDIMLEKDQKAVPTLDTAELIKQLLADEEALATLRVALGYKQEAVDAVEKTSDELQDNAGKEGEEVNGEDGQEGNQDAAVLDVDWYLLSAAFNAELGDAKLDSEAIAKLEDAQFCGPDRVFPIADSAHVDAARKLVAAIKLPEDQKELLLAEIDRRAEAFVSKETEDTGTVCKCQELKDQLDAFTQDYRSSLELATNLQNEVDSLKEKLEALDNLKDKGHDSDDSTISVDKIKPVENESASSSQVLADSVSKLSDYEKKIVSRYKELRDRESEAAANRFLSLKYRNGYLSRTFDITPHIQENE